MTARKIKTERIEKNNYSGYLKKAQDFFDSMQQSFLSKNWNAVGLNAVHCAISANDAVLAYFLGVRSVAESHQEAVDLLQNCEGITDRDKLAAHLRRIINKKNLIEYESRPFYQSEAEEILKQTERFYNQIRTLLI